MCDECKLEDMGMKNRGMGVMSSRCGEHGMNIVMRKEVSQVRGVMDDELKVMGMTMGMNREWGSMAVGMKEIWRKEWLGDLYGEQGTGEVMCMVHEGIRENGYEG